MAQETQAGLWAILSFLLLTMPFAVQMVAGECPAMLWYIGLGGGVGGLGGALGMLMQKPKNNGR